MSDDLVKRLHSLHKQATVERSHFYVGWCAKDAADRIEELEAKLAQQDDLVQAAVAVREAQKAYFKDRSRDNLIASKQAEAALDKMLAAIREGGV